MNLVTQVAFVLFVSCGGTGLVRCISIEDIKNLKESFELYDTDSDGGINIAELNILLRYLEQSPDEEQLKKLFKSVDLNDSGKISFSEFCGLMGAKVNTPTATRIDSKLKVVDPRVAQDAIVKRSFDMFDLDNNGIINLTELDQLMKFLDRRLTKPELTQILNSVDADKNGGICSLEFQHLLAKAASSHSEEKSTIHLRFSQIDIDGNGYIDMIELYQGLTVRGEKINSSQFQKVFNVADVNKDGWVNFEEFVQITK